MVLLAERNALVQDYKVLAADHSGLLQEHNVILADHSGLLQEHNVILADHSDLLQDHKVLLTERNSVVKDNMVLLADRNGLLQHNEDNLRVVLQEKDNSNDGVEYLENKINTGLSVTASVYVNILLPLNLEKKKLTKLEKKL